MNYASKRQLALKLIMRYGGVCDLRLQTAASNDKKWRGARDEAVIPRVGFVMFADDGETFINHNIVGNVRNVLLAPDERVTDISIGDHILLPTKEIVTIDAIKKLDPDTTGAILWTLLVH